MSMFCYQCEQTAQGTGCTSFGVCGKDPQTAALQDLLIHSVKGISQYAHRARQLGAKDPKIDAFVVEVLFSTVTNVNFDPKRLADCLTEAGEKIHQARGLYEKACKDAGKEPDSLTGPAQFQPAESLDELIRQGQQLPITSRIEVVGEEIAGLEGLVTYGLKGMAAYADHARILGREDEAVYAFFHEALDFLACGEAHTADELLAMALRCGEVNLSVMEMLDAAHTGAYGHPTPTQVRVTPVAGKAICVSGHDLKDLKMLLEQTEGKGINIYTHGEMLPAHGYPGLKEHKHLVGNYGGAWQDQRKEFDEFPGAILMTTNCIQKPEDSYKGRIFTTGLVAWPDVTHISADADGRKDFTPVIEAALAGEGFAEDAPEKSITVGFGHEAVMGVAGQVVEAVKAGKIRHFFLIGGCDGAKPGRNYYTELAADVPDDCVILTLACGKYRFNKQDFGDIGGIPRLLDLGQCNDAYSAVRIVQALAEAFDCGVNDLPLSLVISWYEQKAVVILLTLLHLGICGIRLGPSLPAFIRPAVLNVLAEKFNIMPISTPQADLEAMLS